MPDTDFTPAIVEFHEKRRDTETFKHIDGTTYVSEGYLEKTANAERRNGLIVGVIIGLVAGIIITMLTRL